jgi:hypothetical protein
MIRCHKGVSIHCSPVTPVVYPCRIELSCQDEMFDEGISPSNIALECSTSTLYLDVSLKLDTNGQITTKLYDKRDDFNFSIAKFPYLYSNIPALPAYSVYISQLIQYKRACSKYVKFLV